MISYFRSTVYNDIKLKADSEIICETHSYANDIISRRKNTLKGLIQFYRTIYIYIYILKIMGKLKQKLWKIIGLGNFNYRDNVNGIANFFVLNANCQKIYAPKFCKNFTSKISHKLK